MVTKSNLHSKAWNWLLVVLSAVMLFALGGAMAAPSIVLRAQPDLLRMAAARPEATVGVIVQKAVMDTRIEEAVVRVGGTVTQDLSIINAFAAKIPATAVVELAQLSGVRWISLDAPVVESACPQCIDTSKLQSAYIKAIGADRLWNESPYFQGQGITIAVVDSGIANKDLNGRVVASVRFSSTNSSSADQFGHGTHVAGIIGGSGQNSGGAYVGVAPKVNLVDVKVSDNVGKSLMSDVIAGLQWVYNNRARYNIRVVNLSMNSTVAESYNKSPLDAALEILWFKRVVVVVSAGNNSGSGVIFPPANDPFVITVGAIDDKGTANTSDDTLAHYSPYGNVPGGFKPDLVAPGTNIVSLLASNGTTLAKQHRDHVMSNSLMRMSGTSMASAVTAGAAALLIQSNPNLTPDQVKYRLIKTARRFATGGAGYLDIYAAVKGNTTQSANTGLAPSALLRTGRNPITWTTVNWDSVNWDSVNWDSVNWDSVNWDSVNWESDYWGK